MKLAAYMRPDQTIVVNLSVRVDKGYSITVAGIGRISLNRVLI